MKNRRNFLKKSAKDLISSRPTAIDLKWAVDRVMNELSGVNSDKIFEIVKSEAEEICEEDIKFCENIGLNGFEIIEKIYNKKKDTVNILTHCNAGWLATINWGTATYPIYHAHKKGIPVHDWADETRPKPKIFKSRIPSKAKPLNTSRDSIMFISLVACISYSGNSLIGCALYINFFCSILTIVL